MEKVDPFLIDFWVNSKREDNILIWAIVNENILWNGNYIFKSSFFKSDLYKIELSQGKGCYHFYPFFWFDFEFAGWSQGEPSNPR